MVKHTQTNCLNVFDHFVGLALEGLSSSAALRATFKPSLCNIYQLYIKVNEVLTVPNAMFT